MSTVSEVVRLVTARERELREVALQIIEEFGSSAGYEVGVFARLPKLDPTTKKRLLAVADIIEREQGFGWYFEGDEPTTPH